MFEVVQNQQAPAVPQLLLQGRNGRKVGPLLHAQHTCDSRGNHLRVAHRGQRHEEDAIVELREEAAGHQDGQPGLAASSRASQRDQPIPLQQPGDLPELPLPADEAGQLSRQRAAAPPGPRCRGQPGRGIQAGGGQLEQPDRPVQVLQPALTQID